ncbi:hypothetical protein DVT68_14760 [Dyella solisilvae]|uniref:Transposase n=1 Tax=Dyella solisilvae TaxID=1920168 RepID=A0A370K4I1_9GAMM|nr:hypothetical protein DVT68_14760 [Dyella solisilvae]
MAASFQLWREKLAGMELPDARRLKTLEAENENLKKMLAEAVPLTIPTYARRHYFQSRCS